MFIQIAATKKRFYVLGTLGVFWVSFMLTPLAQAEDALNIKSVDVYPSQITVLTEQGGTTTNYQCGIVQNNNGISARHEFDGQEISVADPDGGGQGYAFYFRANFPEGLADIGCNGYQGSNAQRRVLCQMDLQSGASAMAVDCSADANWTFSSCVRTQLIRKPGDIAAELKKIGAQCDAIRSLPVVAQQLGDPDSTSVVESEMGLKGMKLRAFNQTRGKVLLNALPR